jgi:glycosyltransferase involved in cell wall biosynthesis
MTFFINGKFTVQRTTGVQRVARELVRAVNTARRSNALTLIMPDTARREAWAELGPGYYAGPLSGSLGENAWEQITLPVSIRATATPHVLLSLCNTGPLVLRHHVVMIHDMAIYDMPHCFTWKFRLWYRLVFTVLRRRAMHFLTVSEYSRRRIMHHLHLPAERISLIRPAVDHLSRVVADDAVLERFELETHRYCLLVGSLDPRKNLMRCLAAIEQVDAPPGFKFVLAGGSNTHIFEALPGSGATAYSRTLQLGFVSDAELKALYENATCFVFPSLYEGFGLPPLEAMYCGCPVIASREAALPEVCGDAASYCDANSIDDIAVKITQMVNDPALRERYRRLGLERARTHRWSQAAEQLEAALSGLAASTPGIASNISSQSNASRARHTAGAPERNGGDAQAAHAREGKIEGADAR